MRATMAVFDPLEAALRSSVARPESDGPTLPGASVPAASTPREREPRAFTLGIAADGTGYAIDGETIVMVTSEKARRVVKPGTRIAATLLALVRGERQRWTPSVSRLAKAIRIATADRLGIVHGRGEATGMTAKVRIGADVLRAEKGAGRTR